MILNNKIMEQLVRERINLLLKTKGISINSLAEGNQTLQRKLNRQFSEGSVITLDTIGIIKNRYPNLSMDWLFSGEGEMFNKTTASTPKVTQNNNEKVGQAIGNVEGNVENMPCPEDKTTIDRLTRENESLTKDLERKIETIAELKTSAKKQDGRIKELNATIARLEKMNDYLMQK